MECHRDIPEVQRWDLEDIFKAGEMLRMKNDYSDAYSRWRQEEMDKLAK